MPPQVYPESRTFYLNTTQQWLQAIRREVPEVTSADKAFAWGREHDLSAPREIWRDAWRAEVRHRGYRDIYEHFPEEDRIPRSWMESTEFRYGTPFTYIVKTGELIDEEGVATPAMVSILADVNLTIGEILEQAEDLSWNCWPTLDPFMFIPSIEHVYYRPAKRMFP